MEIRMSISTEHEVSLSSRPFSASCQIDEKVMVAFCQRVRIAEEYVELELASNEESNR